MNLEDAKKGMVLPQKQLDIFSGEASLHHFEDSKYHIDVNFGHYVLEYWHMNPKNPEEIGRWKNPCLIKNREDYQIPDYVFAFQFYDLVRVEINGEVLEGKKHYHESPIIYIGERHQVSSKMGISSVIIDKDGDVHFGESGIVYQEYLEVLKEKKMTDSNKKRILELKKK